ncbi:hypothetical protein PVA44_00530 [Entomospira nematocerorum]|uniref:Uncharacterized protein n=1 Tax=Entomospira nematocerorum TaxID=2719987 RepID=A0A968GCW3_9SPIO|nr:hypothetical protein [Entomospira nematocera]NIZ47474.1 hypothetical protein [Entomospira nematocera]WDI33986.1 hypothetical protein PVA44_00530 [Entomospira nematocera]
MKTFFQSILVIFGILTINNFTSATVRYVEHDEQINAINISAKNPNIFATFLISYYRPSLSLQYSFETPNGLKGTPNGLAIIVDGKRMVIKASEYKIVPNGDHLAFEIRFENLSRTLLEEIGRAKNSITFNILVDNKDITTILSLRADSLKQTTTAMRDALTIGDERWYRDTAPNIEIFRTADYISIEQRKPLLKLQFTYIDTLYLETKQIFKEQPLGLIFIIDGEPAISIKPDSIRTVSGSLKMEFGSSITGKRASKEVRSLIMHLAKAKDSIEIAVLLKKDSIPIMNLESDDVVKLSNRIKRIYEIRDPNHPNNTSLLAELS